MELMEIISYLCIGYVVYKIIKTAIRMYKNIF